MKMMFVRFALGVLGARAATRSSTRALGHGHARSLSSDTDLSGIKERTFVAVKPDGVQRRLIGDVIKRFEQRGFRLVGLKMLQASDKLLAQHYVSLQKKPFYSSLLYYMTTGPVVAMVWEGHNVVRSSRMLVGDTNPADASPGTIRGDFSVHISRNVVHASDSVEGAEREISLWFHCSELIDWEGCDHKNIYHI
ncbi:nucleoside diphosphate kinase, mitochondrial [Pimephales promelas]|uniref:nucleoside diphosphate kinase, mitochondrial n=1 Tax=Pimephales promelas TaxID=90988 RepID=UPI001955DA25|nr:nucleoside diphosphate kinase, mitochondrial [Pimephales promelas]KAG1968977.1 nucleoside diphosphate kinase B isoform a [Pimephales promelas]KAG1968978.1 nucleoside diphosphate kinase B isoform a [Pimephales promelas]